MSLQKGDDAEAFRAFERAAELDPTDTTARVNMGNVLLRAGAFAEAEKAFRQVLANAQQDEGAMLGLAIALRGLKKHDESRATYEKLLALSPRHLAATYGLGVLYADHIKDNEQGALAVQAGRRGRAEGQPVARRRRTLAQGSRRRQRSPEAGAATAHPTAQQAAGEEMTMRDPFFSRFRWGPTLRGLALAAPPLCSPVCCSRRPRVPNARQANKPPVFMPKKPPPPKADAGGDAAGDAKGPKEATPIKDAGASGGTGGELVKETEKKEGDASVKVFEFGTTEIEGRSRWPAITYFTRRMRAEFEAQKLPHRPFLPELGATKSDPAVK